MWVLFIFKYTVDDSKGVYFVIDRRDNMPKAGISTVVEERIKEGMVDQ